MNKKLMPGLATRLLLLPAALKKAFVFLLSCRAPSGKDCRFCGGAHCMGQCETPTRDVSRLDVRGIVKRRGVLSGVVETVEGRVLCFDVSTANGSALLKTADSGTEYSMSVLVTEEKIHRFISIRESGHS